TPSGRWSRTSATATGCRWTPRPAPRTRPCCKTPSPPWSSSADGSPRRRWTEPSRTSGCAVCGRGTPTAGSPSGEEPPRAAASTGRSTRPARSPPSWAGTSSTAGACRLTDARRTLVPAHLEHPEALGGGDAFGGHPELGLDPPVQRVRPEVLPDHEQRPPARHEASEPRLQQVVQHLLADPDRRVGPQLGDPVLDQPGGVLGR